MSVEVALLIVVVLLIGLCAAITVLFSRTLHKMANSNDKTHERWDALLRSNLDRMMATGFGDFKAYEAAERASAGGYEEPEEEEGTPQIVPDGVHNLRELIDRSGGDTAA